VAGGLWYRKSNSGRIGFFGSKKVFAEGLLPARFG
jgi:hypothetical protein